MSTTLIIILVLIGVYLIVTYNLFIRKRTRVREAWSDIEVQLKRRYDLIPNLVETVKGYATHEKDVFEKVALARSQAMQATGSQKMAAEDHLSETIKSLFAVAESYPELKANTNFLDLQKELVDTEDKIQAARRFYNGTVMEYNTVISLFPNNIVAKIFGFTPEQLFETNNPEEREAVAVKF